MTIEEAIRQLQFIKEIVPYSSDYHEALYMAIKALEQPERKKGKWIDNTFCSECGWIHEVEPGFIGSVEQFDFCPNCGCDMSVGEQE